MSKKKIFAIVASCVAVIGVTALITIGFIWGEWTVVTQPTCDAAGVEQRTNAYGKTETRDIPALGHEYDVTKKAPSCTKDGFGVYECIRCDSTYIADFENALGHNYGDWTVKTAATCTINGIETQTCQHCDKANRRIIDAQGHQYSPTFNETVDSIIYVTYECQICHKQQVLQDGEELVEFVGNEQLFNVVPCFSFNIKTTKDEAYIKNNLKIIDAYFNNSEYESYDDINIVYSVKKLDAQDVWEVAPASDYEFDMTYLAKLSGDLVFADYQGETLTFTVKEDENHVNAVEYHNGIMFLHTLESASPGYYPYLITAPENSEYLYLTIGKVDGLEIGQIICVGDITSIEELTADTQCDFGKIAEIYPLQTGEWMLLLAEPDLEEIFSELDISYNEIIDFESAEIDMAEVEEELLDSLYASDDFINFLGSVNVATVQYLSENNLDASPVLTTASFMDKVKITPNVKFQGNVLKATLNGSVDIPLKNTNKKEIGKISVGFSIDLESDFSIDVSYKLKKKFKIPYKIKYFDIGISQTDTISFDFDVNIDMDYALEEGKYVQNKDSGKIHRRNCIHASQIKDQSKIQNISVLEAEQTISQNLNLECKHCRPATGFNHDLLVINTGSAKTIHAYNCTYVEKIDKENQTVSQENATYWMMQGYSCCDWCHPDSREEITYESMMASSLNYSDWQQITTDISQWAKDSGIEESSKKGVTLIDVNIPIAGPIKAEMEIDFVISFQLEASLTYEYSYTQTNRYGMRLEGGSVSPYTTKMSKVLSNDLTLMGKAEIRAGLLVDLNVNISGLSRWIRAGVTADVGLYAEISGILHISEETDENYRAAYFEAGIYLDISAYYKLFGWSGNNTIYAQEWPVVRLGYEKAYYGYVNPIESIEVDGVYDFSNLLEVKYFNLIPMTTSQTYLNVAGEKGVYTITVSLADGKYFSVQNGKIFEEDTAPCQFTDTLIISVKGDTTWKDYAKDSSVFYLKDYEIQLMGRGTIHTEVGHICQVCGETLSNCTDKNIDHLCDICGANVGVHVDSDNDGNHGCDHCGAILTTCVDKNSDHICEDCGAVSDHVGGTASCIYKADCSICGKSYGELDENNHTGLCEWIQTSTTHKKAYSCCDTITVIEENHEWDNGICTECGYGCSHIGGNPTCTTQALCTICSKAYGELDKNNHSDTMEWTQNEHTHEKVYKCCGEVVVVSAIHKWTSGVCSECGYGCNHTGGTATCQSKATCTTCRESYGGLNKNNHTGFCDWIQTSTTHKKAYSCCDTVTVIEEIHEWDNGICTECGYGCSHIGGNPTCTTQALCTTCSKAYGELDKNNHSDTMEWTQNEHTHEKVYKCCGEVVVVSAIHKWTSGVCSECGYGCNHTGGTATCQSKATCTTCGESYGELAHNNHVGTAEWTKLSVTHVQAYDCCGTVVVAVEGHEWSDGTCTECGYICKHMGGTSTCLNQALCSECGESYGEFDASNHVGAPTWTDRSAATHTKAYNCCGKITVATEIHEWENGVCTECDYGCLHMGGTATCLNAAFCIECGQAYGQVDLNNHVGTTEYINDDEDGHHQEYNCCGAAITNKEPHKWENSICAECGFGCQHEGGTATCVAKAICESCLQPYGEIDKNHHAENGAEAWSVQTATQHMKAWSCCGEVIVAKENHEWQSSSCAECGYVCGHTGGVATCQSKAICSTCGQTYGELSRDNHSGVNKWTQTATTHIKLYTCCGTVTVAEKNHEWQDGVCLECRYECLHTGGIATCMEKAKCSGCHEHYGAKNESNHTGTPIWSIQTVTQHMQTYGCCGQIVVSAENHEWQNGVCGECGYTCQHTGGLATCCSKAKCDICGELYGMLNKSYHTGDNKWTKTSTNHKKAYVCCDTVTVAEEDHEWQDGVCSECGYECLHTGGTATCMEKAECSVCGKHYGAKNESNHTGTTVWSTQTQTQHTQTYDCCGQIVVSAENHEWQNGVCGECGYTCQHTGGLATCCSKAECDICGELYGTLNKNYHVGEEKWTQTATTHKKAYTCCDILIIAEETHEWNNGVCTECRYTCGHAGGTTTCTSKAICTICGKSYGELNKNKHTGTLTWTNTATTHKGSYDCCGVVTIATEIHEWNKGICTECDYNCSHAGGTATCTTKATCTICSMTYGVVLDHDEVSHSAKASTCTEIGWDAYVTCSRCDYTTYKQKEALGHSMKDGLCTECYYPYIHIRTQEDLKNISSDLSGNYILLNDIDLGGIEWIPIGDKSAYFRGIFDGNGHSISNFKITGSAKYAGVFGYNMGTIKNLGVENFIIDLSIGTRPSYSYVGGLVGYNHYGTITNSYAIGSTTILNFSPNTSSYSEDVNNYVGGLVGYNTSGTITNSYAKVNIIANSNSNRCFSDIGGLVGFNDYGAITNSYASGDISSNAGTSTINAGGLVGYNYYGSTITNSYAIGDVNANTSAGFSYVGGLVSYNCGEITDSYAMGNVSTSTDSGPSYAGGLVAYHSDGTITNSCAMGYVISSTGIGSSSGKSYAGGLVGYNSDGTITNSYAMGEVNFSTGSVTGYIGGLVGYNGDGTITNSYATGDVESIYSSNLSNIYFEIHIGGLVGANAYGAITTCYATGDVSGSNNVAEGYLRFIYIGGLVGYNYYGTITNCYATGFATDFGTSKFHTYTVGGLVGASDGTITNCYATGDVSCSSGYGGNAGGLVGASYGTITNCYATGAAKSNLPENCRAGGLISYNNGTITNCYRYSGQSVLGSTISTLGTAKSISQLQSVNFQSSTLTWSADDWTFIEGQHPILKNVGTTN